MGNKLYLLNELPNELYKIIQKEINNMKLQKKLIESFAKKGFSTNLVDEIFKDQIDIENLNKMELICLDIALYEYTEIDDIKPEHYYSEAELKAFESYKVEQEERIEEIEIPVTYLGKNMFQSYGTGKTFTLWRKNRIAGYDKNIQRPSTVVTLSSGEKRRKATLNLKGVENMEKRMLNKDIFPTSIAFATIKYKGKKPNFRYVGEEFINGKGTLYIKPVFDSNKDDYAPFLIIDGYHRYTAICNAYEDNYEKYRYEANQDLKELNVGLGCYIFLMTEEEAKQYVDDSFERNDTTKEGRYSLKNTPAKDVANEIIDKVEYFSTNYSNNSDEFEISKNSIICRDSLAIAIEESQMDLMDQWEVNEQVENMSEFLNLLLKYIVEKTNKFTDIYDIKKNSNLFSLNMAIGYFAMAYTLKDNYNLNTIIRIGNTLVKLDAEKEFKQLKLSNKSANVKKVYDYFKNLVEEI